LSSYLKKANNDQENIVGVVTPLDPSLFEV